MTDREARTAERPLLSIIIAVYEDWTPLDECLRSLHQQKDEVNFEVIIVDDGSSEAVPESIGRWSKCYPLTILRQSHAGISAARNRGVQVSKGEVLLFTDADCRFQINCLLALARATAKFPQHKYFQLHLVGDRVGVVGRSEELRLAMLQAHLVEADGRIRYLNTAGFAIRRSAVDTTKGVFDTVALRAEDTFLMATLMQRGELPLFVPEATVQHSIPLTLTQSLRKDLRSIYLEAKTYDLIASKGVKFRLGHRERLAMLRSMWKASAERSIGRNAWFVVTFRQGLRLVASYAYRCFRAVRLTSSQL
ncbi:MAG: glycosyltransferase family 2 protein [Candidatus Acidiferrales bacterium]